MITLKTAALSALSAALVTSLVAIPATSASASTCKPTATIVAAPFGPGEVQVKAVNDRGDIVGFAPGSDPADPSLRAILWKHGQADSAVDLGVLPGYVASEAYGVNNDRVVVGVLYDAERRSFPFRWKDGRMELLKGPDGRRHEALIDIKTLMINDRGQIAGTLVLGGQLRAVRWSPDGEATALPKLPGHAWSYAFGINDEGLVSGWSRLEPSEDAEENPVIWPTPSSVVPLKTAPNRADGIAEATNASGLTVGYLGNLGTPDDPEADEAVFWKPRSAEPTKLKMLAPHDTVAELVDVNDRGQAAGMSGTFTDDGFPLFSPVYWLEGWKGLRPLPLPAASQPTKSLPVVTTFLNDINENGLVVGNAFALVNEDPSTLERIDPIVWQLGCRDH